jgi:protein HOOK3
VLNHPSLSLDVPDLQAIAKDHDAVHTMAVCRLVLAIAVQSEKKQEVVEHIKKLSERHQSALMRPIEEVCLF